MESFEEVLTDWPGLLPGTTTLLTDKDPLADGHALLLHLLAQALRQGAHVYCLVVAAPQSHYAAVLRKLGVAKAKLEEEGEATALVYKPLLLKPHAGAAAATLDLAPVLKELGAYLQQQEQGQVVVVIDDLSLVAGVYRTRAAIDLVQACRGLLRHQAVAGRMSLLVRMLDTEEENEEDEEEDEGTQVGDASLRLLPLLLRTADALLEVRPLASGYSRDVHGLIIVRARPTARPQLLNFKLGESGIKCGRLTGSSALG